MPDVCVCTVSIAVPTYQRKEPLCAGLKDVLPLATAFRTYAGLRGGEDDARRD